MNKNKILSGGGKNLTGGGKWGWRGREVGAEGEGSGGEGGGKWGMGTPCPPPLLISKAVENFYPTPLTRAKGLKVKHLNFAITMAVVNIFC